MAAFELDILTSAGAAVGFGPLITAQSFDVESALDKAGAVAFDAPRADIRTDLIAERMIVRCSTLRGGQWTVVGTGIVDDITEDIQPDQAPLIEVGCNDQLISLADRTVGNLTLTSGTGGKDPMAAANLLPAIMAFVSGWTVVGTPSEDTYLAFSGESVLAAIGKLASQIGDHFRLDANLTLTWLPKMTAPVASGIRAISHIPNPTSLGSDTCFISHWQRKRDASKQATRVYAYGAGNAGARVDLSGTVTYTLPAGYSYGSDTSGYYIRNDVADAANRIDAIQTFNDVAELDTATGHKLSAKNALAQTAVVWLVRHINVFYSYELEVAGLTQALLPGQTIRVVIDQYFSGRRIAVIDADLLILGTKTRLDSDTTPGLVSLTVANSDRWPEDDETAAAGAAVGSMAQSSHLQVSQRALNADTAAAVTGQVFDAGVGVWRSTNQSINSAAWTAIGWDTEVWDSAAGYYTSGSALVAQTAGTYTIDGGVEFANNVTGNRGVRIRVNAATYIKETFVAAAGGTGTTVVPCGTLYHLAAGDAVRLEVWQDSGGALNVLSSGNYSPVLRMAKVGA